MRKQKVFGITTSNGKSLCFFVPLPWNTEKWAALVTAKVVPFLKKSFPGRAEFKVLLDGEKVLHGLAAKMAMRAGGMSVLPNWVAHSPDMNPQERMFGRGPRRSYVSSRTRIPRRSHSMHPEHIF